MAKETSLDAAYFQGHGKVVDLSPKAVKDPDLG